MPLDDDLQFDASSFSGVVRLFPLPNLVMFPHVLQPLHVFETRYREMLEDALSDDRLIAMALLKSGWEKDYEGRPPVEPIACLGRVTTYTRLADGRYNLLLAGVARIELGRELPATHAFRRVEAKLCSDHYPAKHIARRETLQRQLFAAFRRVLPSSDESPSPLEQLLGKEIELGVLTDIMAYTLRMELAMKANLLKECNVYRRAKELLDFLATRQDEEGLSGDFPPKFSVN